MPHVACGAKECQVLHTGNTCCSLASVLMQLTTLTTSLRVSFWHHILPAKDSVQEAMVPFFICFLFPEYSSDSCPIMQVPPSLVIPTHLFHIRPIEPKHKSIVLRTFG